MFEGARLIVGDESAPFEDSAFIVQDDKFSGIGRRGDLQPPDGAVRVDFIVLDANPLDNIVNSRRITKVYLRGKEVERAALRAAWSMGSSR